jgi:predicted XRE-type DNA-binding protein
MDTKEIIQEGSVFLRDCFRDAMDHHYEKEIALAVARQKEEDVCCTIAAFLELKVSETEIMRLLSKFYGVDSIAVANELIMTVKANSQVSALKDYLNELGMSRVEVINYLKKHRVRAQLLTNSKLQNMAIDKLKAYFDKH